MKKILLILILLFFAQKSFAFKRRTYVWKCGEDISNIIPGSCANNDEAKLACDAYIKDFNTGNPYAQMYFKAACCTNDNKIDCYVTTRTT